MANDSYTASSIDVLEGLEAVRRRPSMYIGGVDTKGLHHLIWEIVDNSVDEFLAGHATLVKITLHKDGQSITVEDNGRGIPVDKHPKRKVSALEVILTTLHAGGKFTNKNYERSGGLHGVGSSVVNALSKEMTAVIHRDGFEWEQSYKRGLPTAPVKKVKPFRGHGTIIHFRPDEKIFRKTVFHSETIRQHLDDISYIHGGLKITFEDQITKETIEYFQPDGISAYLTKMLKEEKQKPVHDAQFALQKDDKVAKINIVLQWTESTTESIRSYVNGIRTHAGGTHLNGLRSGINKAVKNYMETHDIKPKGVTITPDDIREGIYGILSVFISEPMFQGQTKEKLNNPELTNLVESMVRPSIETWLNNNASVADGIIGRIILAARARQASRDAVAEIRRKSPSQKKLNLPGKLLDCYSTKREITELFLVEGDSAAGTAAMGRNSKTQAVLPLRGKILNTEGAKPRKLLSNQLIVDIIDTLGTGVGADFNVEKLRYGRIILLMDADSDGYHISTLLLTFFFRHMLELVKQHKLFIAKPPLYRIAVGSDYYYADSDLKKEEIIESIPKNKNVEISRFKGLGEMNASQLKETTLEPKKRTLMLVELDSLVDADNTFMQLLGNDPSERYKIIMNEATFVDDVDL